MLVVNASVESVSAPCSGTCVTVVDTFFNSSGMQCYWQVCRDTCSVSGKYLDQCSGRVGMACVIVEAVAG